MSYQYRFSMDIQEMLDVSTAIEKRIDQLTKEIEELYPMINKENEDPFTELINRRQFEIARLRNTLIKMGMGWTEC